MHYHIRIPAHIYTMYYPTSMLTYATLDSASSQKYYYYYYYYYYCYYS